jgi:hypothetical protein
LISAHWQSIPIVDEQWPDVGFPATREIAKEEKCRRVTSAGGGGVLDHRSPVALPVLSVLG